MLLHGNHRIRNVEPGSEDPVVVSVIYVTAAKTFDGPVGGYKTLDGSDLGEDGAPPAPTNASSPSQTEDAQNSGQDSRSPTSATPNAQQMSMGEPTQISAQLSQQTLKSEQNLNPSPTNRETDAAGSFSPTFSTKFVKSASEASATDPSIATSRSAGAPSVRESSGAVPSFTDQSAKTGTASSVPTLATTNKTQKMSGGAAAGLVIGILVIIGALFLLFLCLRRKKNMKKLYGKTDDEKAPLGSQAGVGRVPSTNSVRTTASAPRLSLRPVTQFLPDLGGRGKNSNMSPTADGPTHDALNIPNENFSEKKGPSDQGNEQTNPFGAHAEVNDGTAPPVQIKQATNPFGNQAEDVHSSGFAEPPPVQAPAPLRVRTPTPDPSSANGVVAAAILGGARDERYKTPNQLNVSPSRSISPVSSVAGTEFSTTSISPNHPVQSLPQSNVHRVQLDFKPSMDDELGLQAGQLVRLLHEYDDGWVSFSSQVTHTHRLMNNAGPLHSSRSLSTRRRPSYLPLSSAGEAPPRRK